MKYRAEIDGLRAIAVISVILCHAGLESFSGGFVGVDIFFVISGYLITSIVMSEIEGDRFRLSKFYERRARRILPALLLVLSCTYLFSWLFNLPAAHKVVGQYVASSLTFSTNFLLLLKGADYFGPGEFENPLIHTWSLSVEEQFYLIFPFFLIYISSQKRLKLSVISVFLFSLFIAIVLVDQLPVLAFYLTPARIWEIMMGSIIALFGIKAFTINSKSSEVMAIVGLLLIVVAVVFFNDETPTPSLYTLVPTLGAALIIVYASSSTYLGRFLQTPLLSGIGLISYGLYLWHQPIFAYGKKYFSQSLIGSNIYILILATFVASYLSWVLIERPARTASISTKKFIGATAALTIFLCVFATFGHLNNGFSGRNELTQKLTNNTGFGLYCNGKSEIKTKCTTHSEPHVVAMGNSYMMHFIEPLADFYQDQGLAQLTQSRCKLGFVDKSYDFSETSCGQFYENALKTIKNTKSVKIVYLSSPFRELHGRKFRSSFVELLDRLRDYKVVVLGPTPSAPMNVGDCFMINKAFSTDDSISDCDFLADDIHQKRMDLLREVSAMFSNVQLIDITSGICSDGKCAMEPKQGLYMYIDHGHLSRDGSAHVFKTFAHSLPRT